MSARIQVTITGWYTPEPESYPADIDDANIQAMADSDYTLVEDGDVALADVVDWLDEYVVAFKACP